MKLSGMILVPLVAAGILIWLIWQLFRLKSTLRLEKEENRHLRGFLQVSSQLAQDNLEQLRQLRHDLRHYLMLSDSAGMPGADFLQDALASGPAASNRENWAIRTLEKHYLEQAKALGFQADLRIDLCTAWEDAIPDLCLVLSNLLENSMEALQREGSGWVRVRSICTPGYLSLVVGNTCTQPLHSFNGRYLSSKAPGRFGIGLSTVRRVAEHYDGQAEFSYENGEFRASVFLLRPTAAVSVCAAEKAAES